MIANWPGHALQRLLRPMAMPRILTGRNDPQRGLGTVVGVMPRTAVTHCIPARLMLPMVISPRQRHPILGPNDLGADAEAAALQRRLRRAGLYSRMTSTPTGMTGGGRAR
jgi:hypothetical protein